MNTKMIQLLKTTIFALSMALLITIPTVVQAQTQAFTVSVTPDTSYIRIKPGSKVRHTITIENKGVLTLTLRPTIFDFKADGTTGRPILVGESTFPYLAIKDISQQTISIPGGKRAQLALLFTVPEDAEEKEYPLTVLFESTPTQSTVPGSSSQLVGAIGSNLIVLISHDEQASQLINIDSISIPKIVDSFKKVTLKPLVKNNNFAATNVAGTVIVKNMFDTQIAHFNIFPDTILGFSSREIRAMRTDFQKDIEPEAVPFAFDPSFLLGLYTVEVTVTQPYTSESQEVIAYDTFTFFAIPFIPTLITLIATGAGIFFFLKKRDSF